MGNRTKGEEETLRLILDTWISDVRRIDANLSAVAAALITFAKKNEHFANLVSLKGVSDLTAARLIAELRDLNDYTHFKQIEKLAGANVRLMDSGKYLGTRRISKIGNKRLLHLLYLMTSQVVRFIPELRIKFLKRQLKKRSYRKNVVACIHWFLKLFMALTKEKRPYEYREEAIKEMNKLEAQYTDMKDKQKKTAA